MPVKRRIMKRRTTDAADLEAWSTVFQTGWDFFDDLGHGRVPGQRVARQEAEAAWRRLGAAFLDASEDGREPWALREFGRPPCP